MDDWRDNRVVLRRLVILLAMVAGVSACAKAQARMPAAMPALATPPPPQRVVIPVSVEPVEPPTTPAPPETPPANPRPRETPPARPPSTPPATAAPPAQSTEAPPPVLQTTPNVAEIEKRVRSLIGDAERDLGKVDYRMLSRDAREQYDTARGFVRQAEQWLKLKNYLYAEQLASKAAALASLLVKRLVTPAALATSGA
jgi:outer membrane biosynthesis protein TonB